MDISENDNNDEPYPCESGGVGLFYMVFHASIALVSLTGCNSRDCLCCGMSYKLLQFMQRTSHDGLV